MKFPWLLVRETFVITKNISCVFEEAFVLKYVLIVSGFFFKIICIYIKNKTGDIFHDIFEKKWYA